MGLVINEHFDRIFLCKTLHQAVLMLPNPFDEIGSNAQIKRAIRSAGQYVYPIFRKKFGINCDII